MEELISGLQPLVLWMANSIELLHFIQHEVPQLLPWRRDSMDQGGHFVCLFKAVRPSSPGKVVKCVVFWFPSERLQAELWSTQTACEEAMTVLEEVIMFTFQQSVYYLTKVCPPLPHVMQEAWLC